MKPINSGVLYVTRVYNRGATRSFQTLVPGGFTRTGPARHRDRVCPQIRRVFRAGYPLSNVSPWSACLTTPSINPSNTQPGFSGRVSKYPLSNVSPWSGCLTATSRNPSNTQKTIQRNTRTAYTNQLLIQLRRPSIIVSFSCREPENPFESGTRVPG